MKSTDCLPALCPVVPLAMIVAGLLTFLTACSCNSHDGTDGDVVVDALEIPDDESLETHQDDTSPELDASGDPDTTDADLPDASSDCFLPFESGYDLAGIGLEEIPRDRPPTFCGECCRQVSYADDMLTFPSSLDVWGRYLVYSTQGSYCGTECWDRVIVVDLASQIEYLIDDRLKEPGTPGVLHELIREPTIYNEDIYYSHSRWVATTDSEELQCEVIHFSLLTGLSEVINSYTTCGIHCWCPAQMDVFGKYLVWQDNRLGYAGGQEVRLFDLETGTESTISHEAVGNPYVWNTTVAYDWFPTSLDIVNVYDSVVGTTMWLTDGVHDRWYISLWESLITWSDARAGGTQANQAFADIYMMDIDDGVEIPVSTDTASQFGSFVFGDLVVWTDLRNDPLYPNNYVAATNHDLYGYRISTGEEFQITDLPGKEWAMHLFDNHVFFLMEDDAGVESIFMKEVH